MAKKLRTVSDIRTALKAKIRSSPRVHGSERLEMFVIEKNRARLEQEKENLENRKTQITKDISIIDEEFAKLETIVSQGKDSAINLEKHKKIVPSKPLKTMTVDY